MKPMPERSSGMPMWKFLSRKRLLLQAMNILHETYTLVAHTLDWTWHIPFADTDIQSALHQSTRCKPIKRPHAGGKNTHLAYNMQALR